jgi:predicted HAD superfamily Cof-like phosphohydrolase
MYWRLIDEEYQELVNSKTEVDAADAVIDLMVVLVGYGLSRGWPMQELWDEVFRSNMSKVDLATGKVKRREDGKILKPETYSPPDIRRVLAVYRSV